MGEEQTPASGSSPIAAKPLLPKGRWEDRGLHSGVRLARNLTVCAPMSPVSGEVVVLLLGTSPKYLAADMAKALSQRSSHWLGHRRLLPPPISPAPPSGQRPGLESRD